MKKSVITVLAGFVLMCGWASADVIFSNSFTGVAGASPANSAEVDPDIKNRAIRTQLDGNGNLIPEQSTVARIYRVQLASSPLNDTYDQVKLTATFKSPSDSWIGVGFQGEDTDTLNSASANSGPWLQLSKDTVMLRGGNGISGSTNGYSAAYSAGSVNRVMMTYHVSAQTVDLDLNGVVLATGVSVGHEYPAGTSVPPSIEWMQIQFNTSSDVYFSDVFVEAIPATVVEYFKMTSKQLFYYTNGYYLPDRTGDIDEPATTAGFLRSYVDVFWKDAQDERRAHWYTADAWGGNVYIVNRYSGRKLKRSTNGDGGGLYYLDLVAGSDTSDAAKWKLNPVGEAFRIESVAYPGWYIHQANGDFVMCSEATASDRTLWHMEMLPHGASLPMLRYDENEYNRANITMVTNGVRADEASERKSFKLGAIDWIAKQDADGCVLRFSIDDDPNGGGTTANLTIRAKDASTGDLLRWKTVTLDSKYAWLYAWDAEESDDDPNGPNSGDARRAFDHMRFKFEINEGEIIRLDTQDDVWIDFLETEVIPAPITQPPGSTLVKVGDNIQDVIDAASDGDTLFLEAGVHEVGYRIILRRAINFWGAGMWHTTLKFNDSTDTPLDQGGLTAALRDSSKKLDIRNMHFQGLRTYRSPTPYCAFTTTGLAGWGTDSVIDSIWWEHMLNTGLTTLDHLRVRNCRVYDVFAGGITTGRDSHNLVYDNNLVRHTDDDGLGQGQGSQEAVTTIPSNWNCRYNTVEFVARGAGIAMFQLKQAKVYRNLVKDCWHLAPLRATSSFDSKFGWDTTSYCEFFDNLCVDNRGEAEIWFSVKYDPLENVMFYDNMFVGSDSTEGLIYAKFSTYVGYDPNDLEIKNVYVFDNVFEYTKADVPVIDIFGTMLFGILNVDNIVVTYTGNRPDLLSNGSALDVIMSGIELYEVQTVP